MHSISTPLSELVGQTADSIEPATRKAAESFARLFTIVARLRAPDGCPWDREQSIQSIRGNIVEEAYELVEAIGEGEREHIREESGDLFLLAAMTTYMCEQEGSFSTAEALDSVSEKLLRRHPHVFGDSVADTPDAVVHQWNKIKEQKEGRRKKDSMLDEVPRHLPPLERAYKLQKKAAKAGFDWPSPEPVWSKVEEELAEARQALARGETAELEAEIGDLLFSMINLSRVLGIDPGLALMRTNEKFSRRFRHVERGMKEKGLPMSAQALSAMDELWEKAKEEE
ncbi:MAG: nucleoside triphosphate pyrophosphohydrolase [Treponema sp.]|nr:nucleoside triphosphate pyrophosphohydrolase [Treponema sp.]